MSEHIAKIVSKGYFLGKTIKDTLFQQILIHVDGIETQSTETYEFDGPVDMQALTIISHGDLIVFCQSDRISNHDLVMATWDGLIVGDCLLTGPSGTEKEVTTNV